MKGLHGSKGEDVGFTSATVTENGIDAKNTLGPEHILSRINNCIKMVIGQLAMRQLHILHGIGLLLFHNCTNCDQLHTKICSD